MPCTTRWISPASLLPITIGKPRVPSSSERKMYWRSAPSRSTMRESVTSIIFEADMGRCPGWNLARLLRAVHCPRLRTTSPALGQDDLLERSLLLGQEPGARALVAMATRAAHEPVGPLAVEPREGILPAGGAAPLGARRPQGRDRHPRDRDRRQP